MTSGIYPLLLKNCEPATGSIWKKTGVKKDLSFRYIKSLLFKQGCISGQHLFWTISISSEFFYKQSQCATLLLPPHKCLKLNQMLFKANWLICFPQLFREVCIWALRNAHQKLQIISIPVQWGGEDKLGVIGISSQRGLGEGLGEICQLFPGQWMEEAWAAEVFPALTRIQPWP